MNIYKNILFLKSTLPPSGKKGKQIQHKRRVSFFTSNRPHIISIKENLMGDFSGPLYNTNVRVHRPETVFYLRVNKVGQLLSNTVRPNHLHVLKSTSNKLVFKSLHYLLRFCVLFLFMWIKPWFTKYLFKWLYPILHRSPFPSFTDSQRLSSGCQVIL